MSDGFSKRWNFYNTIGALDGKHIAMKCPDGGGSYYYNYKASRKILAWQFQEQARCLLGSCTVMNFVRCKHDSSGSDTLPGNFWKKLLSTAGFLAAARSGPVREDVCSVTADKCRIFRGRTVVTQVGLIRDVPGVGETGTLQKP